MKLQIGRKRIVIITLVICCIIVAVFIVAKSGSQPISDPYAMLEKIESALGDEYKKQSITVLASTTTYGSKDGSTNIYYRMLWTTYYEKGPDEVTGLNTDALSTLFQIDYMDSCQEMKIKDWDAALYKKGESAYLCWTYSPGITLVLEYNPDQVEDSEIIKMAESVESVE